ncbi:hypothetical protein [Pseudomonas luteola]|uniref:hypothetical protein n=1 Tax=Pseudomonas luteola TaxID=47886 RepID=UPI000F796F7C|nr:hypothetical protein [Pseudomonas luteola]
MAHLLALSVIKRVMLNLWINFRILKSYFYKPKRNVYLFLPINGAGLGHLTRLLAIARSLKVLRPDAEIVFFTTSIGVPLVHRAGFVCHHVIPSALLKKSSLSWNRIFLNALVDVIKLHRPSSLVFDGSMPYLGLQKVMKSFGSIKYVWVKRGLYKEGTDLKKIDKATRLFDIILSPGEVYDDPALAKCSAKFNYIAPISLISKEDLLDFDVSINLLRLSRARPRAYVQLGAGNINGIKDLQEKIVNCLRSRGIQVVLGQSPISISSSPETNADLVITDYPNSKYFSAFDFAVLASGYNSVCEAVMLDLPAIFFPNVATGADDQVKRACKVSCYGFNKVMLDYNDGEFLLAVDELLNKRNSKCIYSGKNGAADAAAFIAAEG